MGKIIRLLNKDIVVSEVKYKDFVSLQGEPQDILSKKLLQLSTGISDEEYNSLNLIDGIELMKLVNEVNGLVQYSENFQKK